MSKKAHTPNEAGQKFLRYVTVHYQAIKLYKNTKIKQIFYKMVHWVRVLHDVLTKS